LKQDISQIRADPATAAVGALLKSSGEGSKPIDNGEVIS